MISPLTLCVCNLPAKDHTYQSEGLRGTSLDEVWGDVGRMAVRYSSYISGLKTQF